MNLTEFDPKFDPKTYKTIPHPGVNIFNPALFRNAPELGVQAETQAREQIRANLETVTGKKVYSQHEAYSNGRTQKGREIFEAISSGKAIIR